MIQWYPELDGAARDVPKVFVGNKIDQRDQFLLLNKGTKNEPITTENAKKAIAQHTNGTYTECSALTQDGLHAVFDLAIRQVMSKRSPAIRKKNNNETTSCGCNLI